MKIITIHDIRARERDPRTMAEAAVRGDAVQARLDRHDLRVALLAHRACQEPNVAKKIRFLRQATEYLEQAAAGIAPCKDKCSHCCHIPLLISQAEMDVIAKETGVKVKRPAQYSAAANMQYFQQPCPMLKNNRCSIYASRPIACRIHYNLDRDDILCRVDEPNVAVPYFNNRPVLQMLVQALGPERALQHADIRDFIQP